MKDFLKIYSNYKKQEHAEIVDKEDIIIIGNFTNYKMLLCWAILFSLMLFVLFILFMNYDIRQNQILNNSRPRYDFDIETSSFITIKPETPKETNPYLLPLVTVIIASIAQIILIFMLFFAKTTVTFIKRGDKYWFQMQGLFFNANIGAPISCQAYQSITHDRLYFHSHLVLEIYTHNAVYTLAEKLESGFNSGLPLRHCYFGNKFQLLSSQMDGYVTDIARKLDLIKY